VSHLPVTYPHSRTAVLETLQDPAIFEAFEKFAEKNYIIETSQFIRDTSTWKMYYEERSSKWRQAKATTIAKMYVRQGSPLQINISSEARVGIEQAILKDNPSETIFDAATNELLGALSFGLWNQFMENRPATTLASTRGSFTQSSSLNPAH